MRNGVLIAVAIGAGACVSTSVSASAAQVFRIAQAQESEFDANDAYIKKKTGIDASALRIGAPSASPGTSAANWRAEHAAVMERILNDSTYRDRPDLQRTMLAQEREWAEVQRAKEIGAKIEELKLASQDGTDDRKCQGSGAQPGTPIYIQCRVRLDAARTQAIATMLSAPI